MQKWEYCAITGISALSSKLSTSYPSLLQFSDQGTYVTKIRDEVIENVYFDEETLTAKRIAKLGEEGWELVGTGNTSEGIHMLYFKRPKELRLRDPINDPEIS